MKIKVGYADYTVHPMEKTLAGQEYLGLCDPDAQRLYVNPTMQPQAQACTLIHELIHAMFDAFALKHQQIGDEETICRALEVPLSNVIRDNPKLMEVLGKALRENKPFLK